jgi:hypothetical protein
LALAPSLAPPLAPRPQFSFVSVYALPMAPPLPHDTPSLAPPLAPSLPPPDFHSRSVQQQLSVLRQQRLDANLQYEVGVGPLGGPHWL